MMDARRQASWERASPLAERLPSAASNIDTTLMLNECKHVQVRTWGNQLPQQWRTQALRPWQYSRGA